MAVGKYIQTSQRSILFSLRGPITRGSDWLTESLNSGWECVSISLLPSPVSLTWLCYNSFPGSSPPSRNFKSAANSRLPSLALLTPSSLPHICQPLPWGGHSPLHGWLQSPSPDLATPECYSYVHTHLGSWICKSSPLLHHPSSTPTSPLASIVLCCCPILWWRCLSTYI